MMAKSLLTLCLLFLALSFSYLCAALEPENVVNGHVWLFEDGNANDSTRNGLNGTFVGEPKEAKGIYGNALSFDGQDDGVTLPDSNNINTGGPWSNRTVKVVFNCPDVDKGSKQVLFEEGGRTRGLVIYVFNGLLYVGGWNRDSAQSNWNPGAWISDSIKSSRWYEVAAVLRGGTNKVENDKFEMWLDGKLVEKKSGSQLYAHGDDSGIGHTNQNTVFHDEDGSGDNRDWYEGLIDEIWVLNQALNASDLRPARLSVDSANKLTSKWGDIKSSH